jgi:hypothetical protein
MPTIKVTDQLGLDVDAQAAPTSALLKYFQPLPSLRLDSLDLSKVGGLTLDQPAIKSLSTGVSLQDPINLGDGAPTLSVGAGAHASIQLVTSADDLPGQDKADDKAMQPMQDACYVSFGIEATASADLSATAVGIRFGASPSTKLELVSYSRFPLKAGITLLQALHQTVAAFSLPANSGDLADLPAGQIARVDVSGTLELSGSADLLTATNPLASASLPAPLPQVSVSAGGSITVGVSFQIAAEYEIVARKLDSGAVRLAWYHKKRTDVAVHAQASEGISAGFSGTDLFSQLVGAISASPQADLKELASAGVSEDQAQAIQGAVKAAACRKLEIAVATEISASDSDSATFLYEIVPSALTEESRQAVDQALRGDLTGLHTPELPGVSCVRSIWDNVRKRGLELDINLLGILNYRSIATLSLEGKVLYEPATGSVVITDRATGERIQSTQVNFGADTQKLRHVLAESFLITAAYHGAKQSAIATSLHCIHSFFELRNMTNRGDIARDLRTGVAVGLLSAGEAAVPEGISDFGRTLFTLSTDYDGDLMSGMFLDTSDVPLPREQYETAGRAAIQFLVQEGDDDAVRRQPAVDDALWNRMKDVGQPGFGSLFPGVPAPLIGAIVADYTTIQWWADAMHKTAQELATLRQWLARNPAATVEDPGFQKLRDGFAGYLRQVAANTRDEFGQPWGLIAMNQLASRKAGAKILISGPKLVLNKGTEAGARTTSQIG